MTKSIKELLQELDKLELPPRQFVIFGSGPMAVRGIKETTDLDVLATDELFKKLHKKYPQDISQHPCGCLVIGNIEIGNTWQGQKDKVQEYIAKAEYINGYPFVPLKYVLEWKENSDREKDQKQVKMIREYLQAKSVS